MPFVKPMTSKRRPELFYCALIFVGAIFLSFALVDLTYPFPESVISGDPWWRYHDRKIVIVTVIDKEYSSAVDRKDGSDNKTSDGIMTSSDYFKMMSVRNKISYAEKYGLESVIKGIKDWNREESWANIPALLETMKEYPNSDWLWWIDPNVFISNPSISLSSNVLRNLKSHLDYKDKEMLIGYDCHGLNAASFLIRNSPWARKFLTTVYDPELFKDYKDEEIVIQFLIDLKIIEIGSKVSFVPLRTLNALPLNSNCSNDDRYKWNKDDFVVNFSGCEEVQEICEKRFDEVTKHH